MRPPIRSHDTSTKPADAACEPHHTQSPTQFHGADTETATQSSIASTDKLPRLIAALGAQPQLAIVAVVLPAVVLLALAILSVVYTVPLNTTTLILAATMMLICAVSSGLWVRAVLVKTTATHIGTDQFARTTDQAISTTMAQGQALSDRVDRTLFQLNATANSLEKREKSFEQLSARIKHQLDAQTRAFHTLQSDVEHALGNENDGKLAKITTLLEQTQAVKETLEQRLEAIIALPEQIERETSQSLNALKQQQTGVLVKLTDNNRDTVSLMETLINRMDGRWSQLQQSLRQFNSDLTTQFAEIETQINAHILTGSKTLTDALTQRHESVQHSVATQNAILNQFEQRAENIEAIIAQAVASVSEALGAAQHSLTNQSETLAASRDDITTQMQRMTNSVGKTQESLKHVTEDLTQFADAYAETLENQDQHTQQTVAKIKSEVGTVSQTLEAQVDAALSAYRTQAQTVAEVNSGLTQRIKATGDEIHQLISGLAQYAGQLKTTAESERLAFLESSQQLLADSERFFQTFRAQNTHLYAGLKKIEAEMRACLQHGATTTQGLQSNSDTMTATMERFSATLREQAANAASLMDTLMQQSTEMNQQWQTSLAETGNLSQSQLNQLHLNFDQLQNAFAEKGQDVLKTIDALAEQWEQRQTQTVTAQKQVLSETETVVSTYAHITDSMSATADRLSQNAQSLHSLDQTLSHHAQNIDTVLDNVQTRTQSLCDALNTQAAKSSEDLTKIADLFATIQSRLETSSDNTSKLEQQIDAIESQSLAKVNAQLTQWRQTIETLTNDTQQRFDTLTQELGNVRDDYAAFTSGSEDSLRRLFQTASTLQDQTDTFQQVVAALETVHKEVGTSCSALEKMSYQAANQFGSLSEDLNRPVATICRQLHHAQHEVQNSVTQMAEKAKDFEQSVTEARIVMMSLHNSGIAHQRTAFLEQARYMIEQLHSISYDLTRLVLNETDPEHWKRYTSHDRGIFTRNLLNQPVHDLTTALWQRCGSDRETREIALNYVSTFNRMINESDQSDSLGIVTASLKTSDLGKLATVIEIALSEEPTTAPTKPALSTP